MRAPLLELPGPSFAELFSRSAFSQNKFLDGRRLAEAARQRGIGIEQFPRKALEHLDSVGAVCPIAFSQANYDVETTWWDPDPEYMVWREERNFEPWESHAWTFEQSGTTWISEKYSPWQLLYLHEALRLDVVGVPPFALTSGAPLGISAEDEARRQAARRTLDEEWRPAIKLLIALQTRLWPYRAGASSAPPPTTACRPFRTSAATPPRRSLVARCGSAPRRRVVTRSLPADTQLFEGASGQVIARSVLAHAPWKTGRRTPLKQPLAAPRAS